MTGETVFAATCLPAALLIMLCGVKLIFARDRRSVAIYGLGLLGSCGLPLVARWLIVGAGL